MLEVVQTGQVGKTRFLFDMHRLRKRVFKDRLGWDVHITPGGLEVDDFDLPNTVYLLALDKNQRVIGNWRLLPTSGPTMIRNVWPQFLKTIKLPNAPFVWETSRFAVDSLEENSTEGLAQVNYATQELFLGLTELCLLCGITDVFTMYDMRIARLLKRLDCEPYAISAKVQVDHHLAQVGAFRTNEEMLARLRAATKITDALITTQMLPPVLQEYREISLRQQKTGFHQSMFERRRAVGQ